MRLYEQLRVEVSNFEREREIIFYCLIITDNESSSNQIGIGRKGSGSKREGTCIRTLGIDLILLISSQINFIFSPRVLYRETQTHDHL